LAIGSHISHAEQVEQLARLLAGDHPDPYIKECARSVARASLDLARAREAKWSLLNRVVRFGRLRRSYRLSQLDPIIFTTREMRQIDNAFKAGRPPRLRQVRKPKPLPAGDLARDAEAYCRALPDLLAIERYEIRASAQLCGALRTLLRGISRSPVAL
jgi:hypothetical protein